VDAATRLARLEALPDERDPARRRMLALGLVADRLAEDGLEPILVGGAALEFYTAGGYATGDIDLALESSPRVDRAFADLGFRKSGRFWVREDLDLLFEAPAPAGLPGETAPRTVAEIDGLRVVVIGLEDLLIDRLRAAVHWNSGEDQRWTRRLVHLYGDRLDWTYLRQRTREVPEESTALESFAAEVGR